MSRTDIRNHPKFENVYISGPLENAKMYTKNLTPGQNVYGEKLVEYKGIEFREWDPYRSKLAALISENPITNFLSPDAKFLYLGAGSGTTISHLSDIAENGLIYGVEFAERSIRQLIQNTSNRKNIIPILGDARFPESYAKSIYTGIDCIYQDVAQPNQAHIAIANSNYYLKKEGMAIVALKSQSIDSVSKPEKVYKNEKEILEAGGYKLVESINIHKYAANHLILIIKRNIT
ncbi:MAG: fibrillarin-like rRNA/tRNA 2'-O-methyltransferase [Promethearchaeota archaeon]|nr:MAG: fibrillarin-like rRNA/tRNA 2'-O-methyltransferase [Candidatus Lokiarchaeota archaeon]